MQPAQEETRPPEPSNALPSTVPETVLPPPPTSGFQLEADLRKIGNQPEVVYRYLKVSPLMNCLIVIPNYGSREI